MALACIPAIARTGSEGDGDHAHDEKTDGDAATNNHRYTSAVASCQYIYIFIMKSYKKCTNKE